MKTTNSEKYFREAQKVMVGGVNSPVRSFRGVGGIPLLMKEGKQATIYDLDDNAYTDYCLSWGALIVGHAHKNVVLAAKKAAEKGVSFGTTCRAEIDLAAEIVARVPSVDLVRFVNSGTEATMSAIRLARGFTRRDIMVKFDGCYHGHSDGLLAKAGSGVVQLAESSSLGIPKKYLENTLSLPYNDVETLQQAFAKQGENIACVILEPVCGNMGVIPGHLEFLRTLRELTKAHGSVLIFDETITGFRTHEGCFQSEIGIYPDLTCMGKTIGGGFPMGAYGGRRDIMEHLAPLGGVYQAGTFSGNPIVMRSGLATLKLLTKDFYKRLNDRSEAFAREMNLFFVENNIEAHLSHHKSMMNIRFRRKPVYDYEDAQAAAGGKRYGQLFQYLLGKGIYWPPADLEAFFICGLHTKTDLDKLACALKAFFRQEKSSFVNERNRRS